MANISNLDQQIDQAVDSIQEYGRFQYYYNNNNCFKSAVNNLYKTFLTRKYQDQDQPSFTNYTNNIEDNASVSSAPYAVYSNYFGDAQNALRSCLQSDSASLTNSTNKDNTLANLNTTNLPDQTTPLISPFDRRLDRLVSDKGSEYGLTPISTYYAQAGTIGYTVSESYVNSSKAEKKEKLIKKIRNDINQMQNDDFYVGVPALMNNYAHIKLYGSKGGRYLINQ